MYFIKRLVLLPIILVLVSIVAFLLATAMPGDVLDMVSNPSLGEEQRALRRAGLGLDEPFGMRYIHWLINVLHGNLGYSFVTNQPVLKLIWSRIPNTLVLMGTGLILSLLIAIPAGISSGVRRHSSLDYVVTISAFVGLSMPTFFLGLMFIYFFSLKLGLLPSGGTHSFWLANNFLDRALHIILPASVLGAYGTAFYTRYIRSGLIEVMSEEYINTARAKGVSEIKVIIFHAGRNILISLVTLLGLRLPLLFSGAILAETVFSWPGMGKLLVTAVYNRDSPLLMGIILILGLLVMLSNLLADFAYGLVDPRIRYV